MGALKAAMVAACVALLLAGCASTTPGQAVSPLYDPFRAGGLPAEDGPSGIREDAPAPEGDVRGQRRRRRRQARDAGRQRRRGVLGEELLRLVRRILHPVEDLRVLRLGRPVEPGDLRRRDLRQSRTRCSAPPTISSRGTAASWCPSGSSSSATRRSPPCSPTSTGTPFRTWRDIVDDDTSTLVSEQQADCLAGTYIRWVAEGKSPRFKLSTGDGLNHVLAGVLTLRDPTLRPRTTRRISSRATAPRSTGSARSRSASPRARRECAQDRHGRDHRAAWRSAADAALTTSDGDATSGDVEMTEDVVTSLVDVLGEVFQPKPTRRRCRSTHRSAPTPSRVRRRPTARRATPSSSTSPALAEMGKPADREDYILAPGRQHRAVGA